MTSFGATDRIVEIAASASQMNPPDASPRKPSAQGMTLTPARHHANAAGGHPDGVGWSKKLRLQRTPPHQETMIEMIPIAVIAMASATGISRI